MEVLINDRNAGIVPRKPAKVLGRVLWTAQIVLAALFIFAGVMKFVMPVEQMTKGSSLPGAFFHFIGAVELLGGIGLVLPCLLRIMPVLTPMAACGLVVIMAGATVMSMPMGWVALIPCFIGMVAAFIAYGRFKLLPVQPRP